MSIWMNPRFKDTVSKLFFNIRFNSIDKIFHRKSQGGINRKNVQIETDKRIFSLDGESVQVPG
jgi:hypothetical protein